MMIRRSAFDWVTIRVATLAALAASAVCPAQTDATAQPAAGPATTPEITAPTDAEPRIKPRLELYVPSIKKLVAEVKRSHTGVFAAQLGGIILEMARASDEGLDTDEASAILEQIKHWPDTAVGMTAFAPDTEGRPRWAIRFEWPLQDLYERTGTLLASNAATELLEGVTLRSAPQGRYEIALPDSTVGYLLPGDAAYSYLASHPDLPMPPGLFAGSPETEEGGPSLLVCRLNLTGTEKDSGATFFSSFSAVTDVVFAARVNDDGDWEESVHVHWPPISGLGAKALFGKVKQTFFVPDEAFGAVAFKALLVPGMLDGMAGFGPQVMMDTPGEMTIVGEPGVGPIASSADSQICVTLLPGTGLLPMLDIVAQVKVKRREKLIEKLKEAAEDINRIYREREQREPWHEAIVRDRTVLWSDSSSQHPGMIMPLVMRPVLFTTEEIDARQKEREFLVLAWTSTSPQQFVRRWIDLPRKTDRRHFPTVKKTNGQLWINWKQLYTWAVPYANVAMGSLVSDALLPRSGDVASNLTDGLVTAKTSYTGLRVTHQGPIPAGALVVPALIGASTAPDETGGTDLARERLASQRLKVLHHHCKLFKKDVGRWPAEVAELDGYVDFAGHPELLQLQISSRKRWSEWFEDAFELEDEDEDADEDDEYEGMSDIDDNVYVIEWGRDSWQLGLAPDTFEHLEELYIDQDGNIHRVEKVPEPNEQEKPETGESVEGLSSAAVLERVVQSMERRHLATRAGSVKE